MSVLFRIFALIVKELQVIFGDIAGVRIVVLSVLLQTAIFPLAVNLEVKNATLAIYDEDRGPGAIEFTQRLRGAGGAFSHFLFPDNEAELNEIIETQKAIAVVRISPDFSKKIARSEASVIQLLIDGRRSNSGQIAAGYVGQIAQTFQEEFSGTEPQSDVVVRNWFNPNLDYVDFVIPSLIAVITTVGVLSVTTLSLAREREHGTFDQLLVSPLTPEMIMIGKIVPALLVGALQSTIILCVGIFVYGVEFRGNFLLLYASMLSYALSLAGVGVFISSLCSTQQQAFLGMFAFMMPAMMLSGFASPVENMPEFLQYITWANPIRHFMDVCKAIYLKDATPGHVWELAWPLLVIGAVTLTAASIIFRRKSL